MINADEETLISDLLLTYCSIIHLNLKELYFFYKGKNLTKYSKMKIKKLKDFNIKITVIRT